MTDCLLNLMLFLLVVIIPTGATWLLSRVFQHQKRLEESLAAKERVISIDSPWLHHSSRRTK
jgi:hypothetical protein